jgi:hypothetical protein
MMYEFHDHSTWDSRLARARDAVLELGSGPLPVVTARGSTVSSPKTAKALTRIWSEQVSGFRGAHAASRVGFCVAAKTTFSHFGQLSIRCRL